MDTSPFALIFAIASGLAIFPAVWIGAIIARSVPFCAGLAIGAATLALAGFMCWQLADTPDTNPARAIAVITVFFAGGMFASLRDDVISTDTEDPTEP